MSGDLISGVIVIILTLLVFSRVISDGPIFRAVQYLFVGVSLGYAFLVVYFQVLRPGVFQLINSGDPLMFTLRLTPYLLGALLLFRVSGRQGASWLANIPLALLFGVATALAIGGALLGTLLPQVLDTAIPRSTDLAGTIGAVVLAIGVILTLCVFYFTGSRTAPAGRMIDSGAKVGRWFLIIAFGFFFAGAVITYLSALNERIGFIVAWFSSLFG